ncbi:hypothetical protein Tco_0749294 [Tanacetum coccineum]|uniref:Retrotransposon gag domain-containing protein n=1 Tax=Tanacetum coccineum TaxID=301880 RepID=A0ABQ4YXZ8_9ASTR
MLSIQNSKSVIQNTCSEKEDINSETASSKSVKESSLDFATKDVHAIKYKMSKEKEKCMAYFRSLHSHLQVLSKKDLKGTRIEHGFKRAFMSLFGQDVNTFTSTMLLNIDQLQKKLDKDKFQKDGSMAAFWVVNNQFQKFIDLQFTLDYDSQMTNMYFAEYTGIKVKQFRDTLFQLMGNVKKSVTERTRHQRQYNRRVNKRQMQTQENKIDTGKAVDADLVVTESSETESEVQDDNSLSGNDTDADDADIRPIFDEEPMAEVQLTTEYLRPIEQTTSLLANNADLKAQIQEKVFAIAALKNDLRKLKGNSVDTTFAKTSVLGKPVLQSLRNQSVVRQPNAMPFNLKGLKCQTTGIHSPRSDLRWKPTGRIFKSVGLRWIPTGKLFDSCTSKVDSEPLHGSNVDIPNIHECKQIMDVSAGTSINVQKEQSLDLSAGALCNVNKENLRVWLLKKLISQKPLSYALSWKPCQGDSLNLPDHRAYGCILVYMFTVMVIGWCGAIHPSSLELIPSYHIIIRGSRGCHAPTDSRAGSRRVPHWCCSFRLERFNKQKPRSFEKAVAPVDVENWISHMDKIFDVMDCNGAFKTRLAVYKFEGDALAWWKFYKQAKGGDVWVNTLTWAAFKELAIENRYSSYMQRFLRLTGFLGQVADAARNLEILRDREDYDSHGLLMITMDSNSRAVVVNNNITTTTNNQNYSSGLIYLGVPGAGHDQRNRDTQESVVVLLVLASNMLAMAGLSARGIAR